MTSQPYQPPHHGHGHGGENGHDLSSLIELEAEALRELTDAVPTWVAQVVVTPPRYVRDLGRRTGAGTFALLRRFPQARVTVVDSSPQMLARLQRRAAELGHTGLVAVVRADLDEGLPAVDDSDLVWASSTARHLGDPDRLLAQVAQLRPAGG